VPDHSSDAEQAPSALPQLTRAQLRAARGIDDPGSSAAAAKTPVLAPDAVPGSLDDPAPPADWRFGGPTVARWREGLIAIAFMSLGAGVLAGVAVQSFWSSPWAAASATLLVWVGMAVPIAIAFRGSRPAGLLRFRAVDVLYGVALGGLLRLTQGWLEVATGGSGALPVATRIDGAIPASWWLTDAAAAVLVAPGIEELFFRGVLLIALFSVLRRPLGALGAGIVALLTVTGVFVIVHALTLELTLPIDELATLALLGVTTGLLVLLTGRLWGAVLVHAMFNATFVLLISVGTALS
jgi:hypothetical protein